MNLVQFVELPVMAASVLVPLVLFARSRRQISVLIAIESVLVSLICGGAGLYASGCAILILGMLFAGFFSFPASDQRLAIQMTNRRRIVYVLACIGLFITWFCFRNYLLIGHVPPHSASSVRSFDSPQLTQLLFTRFSIELVMVSYLVLLFSLFIFRIRRARQSNQEGKVRG